MNEFIEEYGSVLVYILFGIMIMMKKNESTAMR